MLSRSSGCADFISTFILFLIKIEMGQTAMLCNASYKNESCVSLISCGKQEVIADLTHQLLLVVCYIISVNVHSPHVCSHLHY